MQIEIFDIQISGADTQLSEVQNIQVAEKNVEHGIEIPLFMIFPRYYSCPSLVTNSFQIGFQVTISVIFHDNHLVSDTIPITIYRWKMTQQHRRD